MRWEWEDAHIHSHTFASGIGDVHNIVMNGDDNDKDDNDMSDDQGKDNVEDSTDTSNDGDDYDDNNN